METTPLVCTRRQSGRNHGEPVYSRSSHVSSAGQRSDGGAVAVLATTHLRTPSEEDGDAESHGAMSVDEVLTAIGVGPFQRRVWLLCGLAVSADGVEKAALMYIMQGVTHAWDIHGEALGLLGSVSGLGQAVGAYALGRCGDIRGRRESLIYALAATFILGGVCAVSPQYWSFITLRFLVNIALGGALPCAFTLLAEFLPQRERATWIPFLYATYGVGRLLTAAIAYAVLQYSWRLYMLAIALPCGALLVFAPWMPESPQFLLANGQPTEARAVLEAVARANGAEVSMGKSTLVCERSQQNGSLGSCSLLATSTVQLLCAMWLLTSLGSEWFNWVLKILSRSGVPSSTAYAGLIIFNANELVVPLVLAMLHKAALVEGARRVLSAAASLAALTLALFATGVAVRVSPGLLLTLSVAASYSGVAVWVLHYTLTPSCFPAEVRSTAFGLCMFFNRLGYIFGPLMAAEVAETKPLVVLIACTAMYLTLIGLACLVKLPEL